MAGEHFFYISPENISNDSSFTLETDEAHHATHVLRMKKNDVIWLLDGVGTAYKGIITQNGQSVSGNIVETIREHAETKIKMHLAVGLIKRNRFEWLLEKAVECGAASITPLMLDRCVKKSLNMVRSQKIVRTAAKQCGRSRFPIVSASLSLDEFLKKRQEHVFCFHSLGGQTIKAMQKVKGFDEVTLIIGPEGDFSRSEIDKLEKNNIPFVSLGKRRLRTETAAITALNILEYGV